MTRFVLFAAAAAVACALPALAQHNPAPDGSYQRTCRQVEVRNEAGRGTVLVASCQDRRGFSRWTRLELQTCGRDDDIENIDGVLTCTPRPRDDNEGRRGRRRGAGLIIYEHVNYAGRPLEVRGDVANLRDHGFDETLSSFQVRRGAWQMCTEPGYRGRCEVFGSSSANVVPLGLNDQISSIRRVGSAD